MNWLTDFVRPKIRAIMRKNDIPEHLWTKCPKCEQMLFHRELIENYRVCRHCQHHMRLHPKERFDMLFDDSTYQKISVPEVAIDPLKFRDSKRYVDRLRDSRQKTSEEEAISVAHGKIGGVPTVIAAFDFAFIGGSMGMAVGEGIIAAAEEACRQHAALIVIPASGGARMQEGILSLMQMPRTVVATTMVKEKKLPYITLLSDPTTGGVSASFAMLGDIAIAEPKAIIGFSGARVIKQLMRVELPEDFQTAEFQRKHGMIDQVVHRSKLKETLGRLLQLLMHA